MTGMETQRSAMRRQPIDIEHAQAVAREHLVRHEQ